ncbi:MAG TPA: transglutaminase-like domain-containing protein [Candidatus Acidoferrum sp.]
MRNSAVRPISHRLFLLVWRTSNFLLIIALIASITSAVWEFSVRQYLRGFSDAIVPEASTPIDKVEAILAWMRNGPPRFEVTSPSAVSPRDPQDTLNYRQLLAVCGSATNAFLNLSRSTGLETRRLLLLTPERNTKHVVAEVLLDGRWVVVDPTYRALLRDAKGHLLTRHDLQDPKIFEQATGTIPGYLKVYSYENFAHVRTAALPFHGFQIRLFLDRFLPGWDEVVNWSLLLERRSFFYLFLSVNFSLFLVLLRVFLAWLADHHLSVPRFHFRENLARATAAFFTSPEIK